MIQTHHLLLLPAGRSLLEAVLRDKKELEPLLQVTVPESWPTVVDNRFTLYGTKGCIELASAPGLVIAADRYKSPFSSHGITRYDPPLRRLRGTGPGAAGERPRRPDGNRDDPGDGAVARRRPPGQDGGGSG